MNEQNLRVAFVVLGMHRSGTSALTRALNVMGCSLPKTLMPAAESNVPGHWESDAIMAFNDSLLDRLGTAWTDYQPIAPRWFDDAAFAGLVDEAVALLGREFATAPLFVLKDPRICRILPFWRDVIARTNTTARYILPIRNPLEVAASLVKRDGMERDYALLLWLRHVLDAERHSRGQARVFTSFDQLLDQPELLLSHISRVLKLDWPRQSVAARHELQQFLNKKERHHQASFNEIENPWLMQWVPKVATVLARWVEHGEDSDDFSVLDDISRSFDEACGIFGNLVFAGLQSQRRVAELEAKLEDLRSVDKTTEDDLAILRDKADSADHLSGELDTVKQSLSSMEADLTALQEKAGTADQFAAELDAARQALSSKEADLAALQDKAGMADQFAAELAAAKESLAAKDDETTALRDKAGTADQVAAELDTAKQALSSSNAEMEILRSQANAVDGLNQTVREQADRLAKADQALAASVSSNEESLRAVAQQEEANNALRADLKEANARLSETLGALAHQNEASIQAQGEIENVRAEAAALRGQIVESDSHLRQRQEEAAQAWSALDFARRERDDLADILHSAQDALREAEDERAQQVAKLVESEAWVFRLAGERKAQDVRSTRLEAQLARLERKLADSERESASLQARHARALKQFETKLRDETSAKDAMQVALDSLDQALAEQRKAEISAKRAMQAAIDDLAEHRTSNAGVNAGASDSRETLAHVETQRQLNERTQEMAALARSLTENQDELKYRRDEIRLAREQSDWLRAVNTEMAHKPKWWWLVPPGIQNRLVYARLARKGLFDRNSYLLNNPDVASTKIDPLRHYIAHGLLEGRAIF